jgi:hypothetical protein
MDDPLSIALRDALEGIEAELLRVAFEAHDAAERGVRLAEAVRDPLAYPALHRLHRGVADALVMSLPAELESWLLRARREGDPTIERLRAGLAQLAVAGAPAESALAELLIFEGVRARLLVAAYETRSAYEAVGGTAEEIDEIAEEEVARFLSSWPAEGVAGVRPFQVLLAGAMVELTRRTEVLQALLARTQEWLVASLAERAAVEQRLRELDPADAALVRNELAAYLGDERLTVEQLGREHPLLLGESRRDALDQRISRFRKKLRAGGLDAVRKRPRPPLVQKLGEDS